MNLEGDHAVIQGSESFITEMIYNLCDNAIKYNKENGSVTVTVREAEDNVQLSVKDTGVGIPFEYQDRVFERFFRADNSRSQELPGTGLGLSIVKHAAQIHNAKIQLDSQPDEGTEITVIFPKAIQLPICQPRTVNKRHILGNIHTPWYIDNAGPLHSQLVHQRLCAIPGGHSADNAVQL